MQYERLGAQSKKGKRTQRNGRRMIEMGLVPWKDRYRDKIWKGCAPKIVG